MSERLDALIGRLASAPPDRNLAGLADGVAEAICRRRTQLRIAARLAPVRVALVTLALALGVGLGGVSARRSNEKTALFGAAAHLAPSVLIDDCR